MARLGDQNMFMYFSAARCPLVSLMLNSWSSSLKCLKKCLPYKDHLREPSRPGSLRKICEETHIFHSSLNPLFSHLRPPLHFPFFNIESHLLGILYKRNHSVAHREVFEEEEEDGPDENNRSEQKVDEADDEDAP